MAWIAVIREIGETFYIDVVDKGSRDTRHPSFPFSLESRDRSLAVDKAERAVKRANEIRISW